MIVKLIENFISLSSVLGCSCCLWINTRS